MFLSRNDVKKCLQAVIDGYFGIYGDVKYILDNSRSDSVDGVDFMTGYLNGILCIVFQGTTSLSDWKDNIRIMKDDLELIKPYNPESNVKVHQGFFRQYKTVRDYIINRVATEKPDYIWVIGHSLGGALATLCALDLDYNFPELDVTCITFGSPRVGNRKFAESFNRRVIASYRIVNANDIVTRIPIGGYWHVKTVEQTGISRNFIEWLIGSVQDHDPREYMKSLEDSR